MNIRHIGILFMLCMLVLSSGCTKEVEVPYSERPDAAEVNETKVPIPDENADLEPLLYIEQSQENSTITVNANIPLNQDSVEEALKQTLQWKTRRIASEPHYSIEWMSSQVFAVRFDGLEAGEGVRFRLDDVKTISGRDFTVDGLAMYRNNVVFELSAPSQIVLLDVEHDSFELMDSTGASYVHPVLMMEGDKKQLQAIIYEQNGRYSIVQSDFREKQPINIPDHLNAVDSDLDYLNDYGYTPLFSDRLDKEQIYAVYGNRRLYALRWREGLSNKIYTAEKAVYGVAASPSGERIALLTASDDYNGPDADLLILDRSGKTLGNWPRAAYISHSDGVIIPYPLSWADEDTVIIPVTNREDFTQRAAFVSIDTGDKTPVPHAKLPSPIKSQLARFIGSELESVHLLPQPAGKWLAMQEASGIWLISVDGSILRWLGSGELLGWTDDGRIAIWESGADARMPTSRLYTHSSN